MSSSALELLHTFGIRPSHQRVTVLTYLLENRHHNSADEIYEALQERMPLLSRTTVYNTLRLFQEAGVVKSLTVGNSPRCYDADLEPHAHLCCRECHTIIDLPVERPDWDRIRSYGGPDSDGLQILFHGLCPRCSRHD